MFFGLFLDFNCLSIDPMYKLYPNTVRIYDIIIIKVKCQPIKMKCLCFHTQSIYININVESIINKMCSIFTLYNRSNGSQGLCQIRIWYKKVPQSVFVFGS